jgi:hypothetical protein
LIQILRIKPPRPVNAGFAAKNIGRVNSLRPSPNGQRWRPATQVPPCDITQMRNRGARRFTAR